LLAAPFYQRRRAAARIVATRSPIDNGVRESYHRIGQPTMIMRLLPLCVRPLALATRRIDFGLLPAAIGGANSVGRLTRADRRLRCSVAEFERPSDPLKQPFNPQTG